jgi:hypothetical protein
MNEIGKRNRINTLVAPGVVNVLTPNGHQQTRSPEKTTDLIVTIPSIPKNQKNATTPKGGSEFTIINEENELEMDDTAPEDEVGVDYKLLKG